MLFSPLSITSACNFKKEIRFFYYYRLLIPCSLPSGFKGKKISPPINNQPSKVTICRNVKCLLSMPWWHMEGSRHIALLILYLGVRGRLVVSVMFQPLYPRKRTPEPLNRRLCGPDSHSGHVGGEKIVVVCGKLKQYWMVMCVLHYTIHWLQYCHTLFNYVIILFRAIVTSLWVG